MYCINLLINNNKCHLGFLNLKIKITKKQNINIKNYWLLLCVKSFFKFIKENVQLNLYSNKKKIKFIKKYTCILKKKW